MAIKRGGYASALLTGDDMYENAAVIKEARAWARKQTSPLTDEEIAIRKNERVMMQIVASNPEGLSEEELQAELLLMAKAVKSKQTQV
jgi:hypothetical protein